MKKRISIFLALMIVLSLAACGAQNNTADPTEGSSVTEEKPDADNSHSSEETLGEFKKDAQITDTIMVDEQDVKITATGLSYNNYSAELELLIENNSGKDLSFISGSIGYSCNSINGIMVSDGYLSCDVAAGKKANNTISFRYDSLMLYGINEIADIEIGFDIRDDDYNHTYTGPRQVKTSISESYRYDDKCFQNAITSDACKNTFHYSITHFGVEELYNENGIRIVSSGIMVNQDGDPTLLLEVVNNSGEQVYLVTSKVTVNGLLVYHSSWSSDAVNADKRCVVDVNLSRILQDSYWDIYGIKEVGEVSLDVELKDSDGNVVANAKTITVTAPGSKNEFSKEGTEVYAENGIRIVSKGLVASDSEYSKDIYALLLIENTGTDAVTVDDVYDSLSVNGFMCDYSFPATTVLPGQFAMVEIQLWEYSLEENKITAPEDVSEIEVSVEIKDSNWKKIDAPVVTINHQA